MIAEGRVDGWMLIVGAETVKVYAMLPVNDNESVAVTVKLKVPASVGVPDRVPPPDRVIPAGNAPDVML